MVLKKFTDLCLEIIFPKFCFNCQKEGSYLCQDCQSILEVSKTHEAYRGQNIKDLYFALPYRSSLVKNLIRKFKYQPFVKELAKSLSFLIIEHFHLLDNKPDFKNFIIIPVPLEKIKLKWRGFNQAEEIAGELADSLGLPFFNNVLAKTKPTQPQTELTGKKRKENIKGVFSVKNEGLAKNKKILLVDDVFTTGATMEEAARTLKSAGAKEVIGIVIARAAPGDDKFQSV